MFRNLQGKTISFEGGEGSGKSTIIKMIEDYLKACDELDVVRTREPGGSDIAEQIRNVILSKDNTLMCSETECLLFAASRAQLLNEKIKPLINEGKTILFDRFVDTSYVYQGYCRGLGIENVIKINDFATNKWLPDKTIIFDIDPAVGLKRIADNNRETNRLDLENLDFHNKVREGYKIIHEMFPERIVVINANQPIEEVFKDVLKVLMEID